MGSSVRDVQPLRKAEQIEDMKWSLKKWCGERDYILFLIGINTGLRVSDLLRLEAKQLQGKNKIVVREGKTKKKRVINIEMIRPEVDAYIETLNGGKWLFPSRKGNAAISRVQAYRQLNRAAEMVDIVEGIGTHTMRKTFGYHFYRQTKDIAALQEILNHSKPEITKIYIGIRQDEIDDMLKEFRL